jgi:DNA-binding transcriptional regulator YiaG
MKTKAASRSVRSKRAPSSNVLVAADAPLRLVKSPRGGWILALRNDLGFNREVFSRLLSVSVRSLAHIEAGDSPGESITRRIKEIERIVGSLADLVPKNSIGQWMLAANDAFDGLKPLEVIERGEIDRIWRMIYFLQSGVPN